MLKIAQFIYPWGNGHFSRMMRLNSYLTTHIKEDFENHLASKGSIYEKLLKKFPENRNNIHEIMMPTPIDGKMGPDVPKCIRNILLSVENNPPLVKQVADYLREERKLYNKEKFDLVINDGDMGSNILAKNRNIPSLFVTNQFRPKLWKSRSYLYPGLMFIAKQIGKASKIIVADSPPPYTICEYNLNFSEDVQKKVIYTGCFTENKVIDTGSRSDLEKLLDGECFGYWMRTGNKSTNDGTGIKYEETFHQDEMRDEKRIVSHARDDSSIDSVIGKDGKRYAVSDALEKKVDWVQIDIGFLSEQEKQTVLKQCKYAVINGSHTVMGEIMGKESKPIIGIPIYDEHTNNIEWAEDKNLGILAKNPKQVVNAVNTIKNKYQEFEQSLKDFSRNFNGNGADNTAKIVAETLEEKSKS